MKMIPDGVFQLIGRDIHGACQQGLRRFCWLQGLRVVGQYKTVVHIVAQLYYVTCNWNLQTAGLGVVHLGLEELALIGISFKVVTRVTGHV